MSFDGNSYIQNVAMRLVQEFEFSAHAGTPGLVGAAKEHPARLQLAKLMPEGIGVGSGMIVDSYGGVSKQQDIIIFEKLCPIFSHSETDEATYYPVEGVIAVGEVKSTLNKEQLNDAFDKSRSVKKLRRHAVSTQDILNLEPTVDFRTYASVIGVSCAKEEEYNQDTKSLHQIYTFILCEKFGASPNTTLNNAVHAYNRVGIPLGPNFIASLKDGFIIPHNLTSNSITRAAMEADGIIFCDQVEDTFPELLTMIRRYVRAGKTVCIEHYDRYFHKHNKEHQGYKITSRASF